jgi:hypothetical protein
MLAFLVLSAVSCSTYNTKKIIDEADSFEQNKKIGIVLRTSAKSRVNQADIKKNLSYSLNGYKKNAEVIIVPDLSNNVVEFASNSDRFYQRTYDEVDSFMNIDYDSDEFLEYKSIGVIKSYLLVNKDELLKTMSEKKCEGLILYEIDVKISAEMQYMTFDSVIVAIDKELNIVYLDYQNNDFNSNEYDFPTIKDQILNKVSDRFIKKLDDMDFVEEM